MEQSESTAANIDRRSRRRWLQFSLRGFLVVLTIGCLWLGWKVEKAHKQREAVKAIEAIGGVVQYDWQTEARNWKVLLWTVRFSPDATAPQVPSWLQELLGSDFFQEVHCVFLNAWHVPDPHTLHPMSEEDRLRPKAQDDLKAVIPHLKDLPSLTTVYLEEPKNMLFGPHTNDELESELRKALPNCGIIRDKVFTVRIWWGRPPSRAASIR